MEELRWGFIEKLDLIFKELELTNIGIAKHGGPDASLISRYRSGARKPATDGKQLKKLATGIVNMTEENNRLDKLCLICGFEPSQNPEDVTMLLYKNMKVALPKSNRMQENVEKDQNLYAFSDRLDALMGALDVSNIRLARALHVDASLVSRFRTGMRIPSKESWFPIQCCDWLAERAISLSYDARIASLGKYFTKEQLDTSESLTKALKQYLIVEQEEKDKAFTDELLNHLNTFQYNVSLPKDLIEYTLKMAHSKENHTQAYYGLEGLRNAVKEFLLTAVTISNPITLYLYSNQPMEWMRQDPEFSKLWALLMGIILQKGHHIRIVHNIERSMPEMFEAIQKWLPLYMSGQIQSYYCEKKSERFYQTKFIIPGHCSVDANMVAGTQDSAEYLYCNNQKRIEYHMQQFRALLDESNPLLRIYKMDNMLTYKEFIEALSKHQENVVYLRATLPLSTMPKAVFEKMLARTQCDAHIRNILSEIYEDQVRIFHREIEEGEVVELMPLYSDEHIFSSKVRSPFPEALVGVSVVYTSEEYEEHIRYVRKLVRQHQKYRFYILPEAPFENVEILLKQKNRAFVIKTDDPLTVFQFEHPMLCQAFTGYIKDLSEKVMPHGYDREDVLDTLTKSLT